MITNSNGFSLITFIIVLPLIIIVILLLVILYYQGRKAYWDQQVDEMCEKDGGIKIYESIVLEESEYNQYKDKYGNLSIPRVDKAPENIQYVHRYDTEFIHNSDPIVRRDEFVVLRRYDNKVIGKQISYSRVGGDFFPIDTNSFYTCPKVNKNLFDAVLKENNVHNKSLKNGTPVPGVP